MENGLEKARDEIRRIDEKMAMLFEERMNAAKKIAEYKKEHGLPVFDQKQETKVLERNLAFINNDEFKLYYTQFLEDLMTVSKKYQHRLTEGMKIAYNGAEGAFAHIAAKRIFPEAEAVAFPSFDKAYEAVTNGECTAAVIPIENSYAGEVGSVMDLMFEGELYVTGVYTLPITQNLLGVSGASINDVEKVISHPQALSQCDQYIKQHGFTAVTAESTAVAAKKAATENNPRIAAIASAETAELYGLDILDHDINESAANTTKFAVFSRTDSGKRNGKFILMFTVNDAAGTLAKAINVISDYGFNMKALRSRPVKEQAWQYYFYVEAEGDDTSQECKNMMAELSRHCQKLKIAGHFESEVSLRS